MYCAGGGQINRLSDDGMTELVYDSDAWFCGSPAMDGEGTLYVGSNAGEVHAIRDDGSVKWVVSTDLERGFNPQMNSSAIGPDGTIYVGGSNGSLYAIGDDE